MLGIEKKRIFEVQCKPFTIKKHFFISYVYYVFNFTSDFSDSDYQRAEFMTKAAVQGGNQGGS